MIITLRKRGFVPIEEVRLANYLLQMDGDLRRGESGGMHESYFVNTTHNMFTRVSSVRQGREAFMQILQRYDGYKQEIDDPDGNKLLVYNIPDNLILENSDDISAFYKIGNSSHFVIQEMENIARASNIPIPRNFLHSGGLVISAEINDDEKNVSLEIFDNVELVPNATQTPMIAYSTRVNFQRRFGTPEHFISTLGNFFTSFPSLVEICDFYRQCGGYWHSDMSEVNTLEGRINNVQLTFPIDLDSLIKPIFDERLRLPHSGFVEGEEVNSTTFDNEFRFQTREYALANFKSHTARRSHTWPIYRVGNMLYTLSRCSIMSDSSPLIIDRLKKLTTLFCQEFGLIESTLSGPIMKNGRVGWTNDYDTARSLISYNKTNILAWNAFIAMQLDELGIKTLSSEEKERFSREQRNLRCLRNEHISSGRVNIFDEVSASLNSNNHLFTPLPRNSPITIFALPEEYRQHGGILKSMVTNFFSRGGSLSDLNEIKQLSHPTLIFKAPGKNDFLIIEKREDNLKYVIVREEEINLNLSERFEKENIDVNKIPILSSMSLFSPCTYNDAFRIYKQNQIPCSREEDMELTRRIYEDGNREIYEGILNRNENIEEGMDENFIHFRSEMNRRELTNTLFAQKINKYYDALIYNERRDIQPFREKFFGNMIIKEDTFLKVNKSGVIVKIKKNLIGNGYTKYTYDKNFNEIAWKRYNSDGEKSKLFDYNLDEKRALIGNKIKAVKNNNKEKLLRKFETNENIKQIINVQAFYNENNLDEVEMRKYINETREQYDTISIFKRREFKNTVFNPKLSFNANIKLIATIKHINNLRLENWRLGREISDDKRNFLSITNEAMEKFNSQLSHSRSERYITRLDANDERMIANGISRRIN